MKVSHIDGLVRELDVLEQAGERSVDDRLIWTLLQSLFYVPEIAIELRILHDLAPMGGLPERHRRGGCIHLLVRPGCPADIVCLQHPCELGDPLILVFARLAKP
jgi:hypothetical protein